MPNTQYVKSTTGLSRDTPFNHCQHWTIPDKISRITLLWTEMWNYPDLKTYIHTCIYCPRVKCLSIGTILNRYFSFSSQEPGKNRFNDHNIYLILVAQYTPYQKYNIWTNWVRKKTFIETYFYILHKLSIWIFSYYCFASFKKIISNGHPPPSRQDLNT